MNLGRTVSSFFGIGLALQLGEDLLDGLRSAVGWKKEKPRPSSLDRADGLALVAGEIIEDDVAWLQRRGEDLFYMETERLAVDRAIGHPWRVKMRSWRRAARKVIVFQ